MLLQAACVRLAVPADPPLDPSGEQGRELLRAELRKLPYGDRRSLRERIMDWIGEQLDRAAASGASTIGKIVLLVAAALLLAVIAYAATRVRAGRRARGAPATDAVLHEPGLSAADYRRRAAAADSSGEHSAALLDWFRAIVRSGEERALLDDRPGGTAHELAAALGGFFPAEASALRTAGDSFDGVRYGGRRADAAASTAMRELDDRTARARPEHAAAQGDDGLVAPGRWAP
ncbi:DUF4129 domain-containing protein [Luteipulveratus halotolerans]|uniref:Protein-glutamine gamma-glutamyltransferase-like C-terminal domain-containing protein n=1 Tax=Luteipulveratus halotolerans TaxID=1631356 RepID=A0A0L6CJZ0_9MICO|nr:DUF4129 domain-containing protein [Luteipulveratus halotolerans]KNX37833.1 hypothetical protein VV01_12810 [Luteipulveratus halotolerans]